MNPRTTGILALVALVLGAYVYVCEIGGEADRKSAAQADSRIFADLDAHSIDDVAFTTLDGVAARFELRDGAWRLVAPVEAPADPTSLEAIVSMLAGLSSAGSVPHVSDLTEYGLANDARIVEFRVGEEMQMLRIGRSTPVGGNLYVLANGGAKETADRRGEATGAADHEVAFVEKFRLNALSRKLDDLRDRRILQLDPTQVHRLEIAWPGTELVLVRSLEANADVESAGGARSDWRLAEPISERADQVVVRDLLTNLEFLESKGFVDDPDARSEAALADVAFDVDIEASTDSRRLRIGGLIGDVRIARGQAGQIFTLAPERLEDFERTITAYRDRTLGSFDLTAARVLEFEALDANGIRQQLRARLAEQGWESDGVELDSESVAALVRDLSQLRADTIVADSLGAAELAPFGLAPPAARIRILRGAESDADESLLVELAIGRKDERLGQFVQRKRDPKIFALDTMSDVSLPGSWEGFQAQYAKPEPRSGTDGEES